MVAVSTVSPGEIMNWNGQKADARQNLLQGKAQNLYQQQLQGLSYGQNLKALNQRHDEARLQIPGQFAQRGTLNSGLYRQALARYAQNRISDLARLQMEHQATQGGFVLNDRGAEDTYAAALQRILGEQYSRQASTASQIGQWF